MNDTYLKHYGTPGHSGRYPWGSGEEPYQRLTRGSARRIDPYASAKKRTKQRTLKKVTSPQYTNLSRNIYSESSHAINSASRIANKKSKDKYNKKINEKIRNMSDQELKSAVDRMNMEKRYRDLSANSKASGFDYVTDVLSLVGSVAAIGVSVATIATLMHADDELLHYGVLGMHWGVRKDPNHTVFVSGSSKTETKGNPYYRKRLSRKMRKDLKEHMHRGHKIIVGDAPGIDRQTQNYLKKKRYKNVEIYGPGKKVRYKANEKWADHAIDAPKYELAMTKAADEAIAVILDEGAKATRNNIDRLLSQKKDFKVYELHKNKKDDVWDFKWE